MIMRSAPADAKIETHGREFLAGARAMMPFLIALAPFGLVIGVSAAQSAIPTLAGWLTGPAIYAGSAQVAVITMLGTGAGPLAAVLAALVINLRLLLYSAAMAEYWRGTPAWWRLIAAYLLVDPSFVVGVKRYETGDRHRAHSHYLGGAVVLWVTWLVAIAVGAIVGAQFPTWLHLEFLVPLYLIGQIGPKLRQRPDRTAAIAAAAVALLCIGAPMHAGVPIAITAGIAAGSYRKALSTRQPTIRATATPAKEVHR